MASRQQHGSSHTLQTPAELDRSVRLRRIQRIGVPLLAAVPLVALAGVLGISTREALNPMLRIAFVYFFLMIALRIMGKREMSEMSPFELVTLLTVPEIFSAAFSRENYNITQATVGVATLFSLVFLTGLVTFRFKRAEELVEGKPTILVHNGRMLPTAMQHERLTSEELFAEMHKAGIERLDQVRWAILEVDGKISIIPGEQPEHLTKDEKRRA